MATTILEVKRNYLKEDEHWHCTLLHRARRHAVLHYRVTHPWPLVNTTPPVGSHTIAHYWTDRDYVAWQFWNPEGAFLGTLYHMADEVRILADRIEWVDMMIDLWFPRGVKPLVADADELIEAEREGFLTVERANDVWRSALTVVRIHPDLVDELTRVRRGLALDHVVGKDVHLADPPHLH